MSFLRTLVILLLFSSTASAGEALYFGIRHQYVGPRAMGMGNAFTAVADDNTAIFYNPAGLSQLEEGESNWFLKADVDPDILDLFNDIDDASNDPNETQAITNALTKNYGKQFSMRLPSLGWIWARPTWGLSVILSDFSMDMMINRQVGPAVNLVATNDSTVAYSHNWHLKFMKFGKLTAGVTGKLIYRLNVDKLVSVAEIQGDGEIFEDQDAREGMTLDADIGALWVGPWQTWNPSASFVIRNIGDYGYFANFSAIGDNSGDPEKLHRVFDIGSAITLPDFWVFKSRAAFDIRDIGHPNWNMMKGIHIGFEANWAVTSWWRGGWRLGLNQGYLTAGFTGELGIFRLDLVTYGEEVGVEGSTLENRRYMMEMSLDF